MKAIAARQPDILIADISLNGPDGLDLLKNIRTLYPDLPVLILSMHDESIYAERALRARANGYIMKQEATEKVLVAVRRILGGDIYLSDRMANKVLHQYISGASVDVSSQLSTLSDRELEVFRLIGEGRSTRQIAEKLHLSMKTVETYQAHIKEQAVTAQRPRAGATRHSGENRRKNRLITRPAHRGIPYIHPRIRYEAKIGPVLLVSPLLTLFLWLVCR